jgi:hypothetical protein
MLNSFSDTEFRSRIRACVLAVELLEIKTCSAISLVVCEKAMWQNQD